MTQADQPASNKTLSEEAAQTNARQFKVVFQPSGKGGIVPQGITIMAAAQQLGVGIESICGAKETCGKCQVIIEEGTFLKHNLHSNADHASPPGEHELTVVRKYQLPPNVRLACAATVEGELLVSVPPVAQAQKQVVHKAASDREIMVDAIIRVYYINLPPPALNNRSDQDRVLAEMVSVFGLENLSFDHNALKELSCALRAEHGDLTLTVWDSRIIVRVQPGLHDRPIGLAVDIGTTTLAAYLCDLRSGELLATATAMNPQVAWGDDILSRISFVQETSGGLQRLQRSVVRAINELARQAAEQAGFVAGDIVDCTLVGNCVMHHIVLGLDPTPLGALPFVPVVSAPVDLAAAALGLKFNPGARVHVLPLIAGYVGADNVGVILAEEPHLQDEMMLIVDVGTNGELVLGNRKRLLCTSSPTGPAFEGAQITHGMRAAPGAIERVRISKGGSKVRFRVIGQAGWSDELPAEQIQARGICGSGILEAVAELFTSGVLLASGQFTPKCSSPLMLRAQNGQTAFVLATAEQSVTGQPITLTQADVRAVQLAKAALYVSAQFLMQEMGVKKVDRIVLAGAFGSLIDQQRAMTIGMIPDCDLPRVEAVGNAAGDGARIALLNKSKRQEAAQVALWCEHISTPIQQKFQMEFVAALAFPRLEQLNEDDS